MPDLVIHPRLVKALQAHTPEQLAGLEENLIDDEIVLDPIVYAVIDGKDIILDGMTRWELIQKNGLTNYRVELFPGIDSLDDAEDWVFYHQYNRRNAIQPAATRKLLGQRYNKIKGQRGGDRSKGQSELLADTKSASTAEVVAKEAGVDESTIKRAGKFAEALEKIQPKIAALIETGAIKGTDEAVRKLATLDKGKQEEIAREVRVGNAPNLQTAMKKKGYLRKPTKKKPKADADPWDNIATNIKDKLKSEIKPSDAELTRLSEYDMDKQREIVGLVGKAGVRNLGQAMGEFDGPPKDAAKQEIPAALQSVLMNRWYEQTEKTLKRIVVEAKVHLQKTPYWIKELSQLCDDLKDYAQAIGNCQPAVVCPACKGKKKDDKGQPCGWCQSSGVMPAWTYRDYKAKTSGKK